MTACTAHGPALALRGTKPRPVTDRKTYHTLLRKPEPSGVQPALAAYSTLAMQASFGRCGSSVRFSGVPRGHPLTPVVISRGARLRRPLGPAMVFTGIVQGTAEVIDVDTLDKFSQVKIKFPPGKLEGVKVGASVAINGTCLTVTEIQKDTLRFDIMMETLRATNLGELGAGSVVNFERAAKLGDEVGGHNVSGHVHCTATITAIDQLPNNRKVTMTLADSNWAKYILPKGYIAVDGTSLTVGEVKGNSFCVYLIPETLRVTVFGIKSVGDTVNIEVESQTQAIVDTVETVVTRYLQQLGISANGVPPAQQQQVQQQQQQQQAQQHQ